MTPLISRLRPYLGVVGLVAMSVYVGTQWESISLDEKGLWWRLALAFFLVLLALVAGGIGWSRLCGLATFEGLQIFASSLPVRYLPFGGFAQLAAQATLSRNQGVERWRAIAAGPAFLASLACGAVLVGTPLIVAEGSKAFLTWTLALGVAVVATLFVLSFGLTERLMSPRNRILKVILSLRSLPFPQAVGWGALSVCLTGTAWSVVLQGEESTVLAIGVFSIGWLVGLVAVFVPAGVGVRESALVLMLPSVAAPDVVVSSLVLRSLVALAELVLIATLLSITAAARRLRLRGVD